MTKNKNYARLFDVNKDAIYDKKWQRLAKLFENPYLSMEHYANSYAHPGAAAFNGLARLFANYTTGALADKERKSNKEKLAAAIAKNKEDYINFMNQQDEKAHQRARELVDKKIKANREAQYEKNVFNNALAQRRDQQKKREQEAANIINPKQREYYLNHPEVTLSDLENVTTHPSMLGGVFGNPFRSITKKETKLSDKILAAMEKEQGLSPIRGESIPVAEMKEYLAKDMSEDNKIKLDMMTDEEIKRIYIRETTGR
jgi:hypothetical protein